MKPEEKKNMYRGTEIQMTVSSLLKAIQVRRQCFKILKRMKENKRKPKKRICCLSVLYQQKYVKYKGKMNNFSGLVTS